MHKTTLAFLAAAFLTTVGLVSAVPAPAQAQVWITGCPTVCSQVCAPVCSIVCGTLGCFPVCAPVCVNRCY